MSGKKRLLNLVISELVILAMVLGNVLAAAPVRSAEAVSLPRKTTLSLADARSTADEEGIVYLPFAGNDFRLRASTTVQVSPEMGGTLSYHNVHLDFPADAVQEPVVVSYIERFPDEVNIAGKLVQAFDLVATTLEDEQVTYFYRPVSFQFQYDETQVDEHDLILMYWDESLDHWDTIDAIVDTESNTISANLGHFSTYAVAMGDLLPEITWVEWHFISGTSITEFMVRTISGPSPQIYMTVSEMDPIWSETGTDYDVNEFTLQVDTGPYSWGEEYSFTVQVCSALEIVCYVEGVSGSFTVGYPGSIDNGIDIGESAVNPPLYLQAWRDDDGPTGRGKPKEEVADWNGYESQDFRGVPFRSYPARLIMNSRCGKPFFVRGDVFGEYENSYDWLGAPVGHEITADKNYPEWLGSPLGEFEHGFISRHPGESEYRAHTYSPSVGNIYIVPEDAGSDQVYLTFQAQVRRTPSFPDSTDEIEVTVFWEDADGDSHERQMDSSDGFSYEETFDDPYDLVDLGETIRFSIDVVRDDDRHGRYPLLEPELQAMEVYSSTLGPYGELRPHPQDVDCESFSTPPDDHPPSIDIVEIWPDGEGNLSILAIVTDDRGVSNVSISGGPGNTDGSMEIIQGTPYGNGVYGGGFFEVSVNEVVDFIIEATDTAGNTATASGSSRVPLQWAYSNCAGSCYEGDPVNAATGNNADTLIDLIVPGRGDTDTVIKRSNNSQSEGDGPFGRGSSFEYDVKLEFVHNWLLEGIRVHYGDGRTAKFSDMGDGSYAPVSPSNFDYLTQESDEYVLHFKDRTTYRFDNNGQLITLINKNGYAVALTYDAANELETITNASGRTVELDWESGHIVEIRASEGKRLRYAYDSTLLRYFTDTNDNTTEYQHDTDGRIITVVTPNGYPHIRQEFDDRGRVVWQINGESERRDFHYDDDARITTVTDAYGYTTTYNYDKHYFVSSVTDARGYSSYYVYDERGNLSQYTDQRGFTWLNDYDDYGNRIYQSEPAALALHINYTHDETRWAYNELNDVISTTNALSDMMLYTYDEDGNLLHIYYPDGSVITTTYNAHGQPLTVIDGEGNVTHNAYDSITGDLIAVTDGEENTTHFGYDALGRQTVITDANSHVVQTTYDGNDNVITLTDAKGQATTFVYDDNNNLTDSYDRRNGHTHYDYDHSDWLIAVTDPKSSRTEYDYNQMGYRTVITNSRGFTTRYAYDAAYNVVAMQDEDGYWWHYEFDPNGNRTLEIDHQEHRTRYVYDAVNRLKYITDPLGNVTELCYNPENHIVRFFDPRRAETQILYDPLGRIERLINAEGKTHNWAYDYAGNLVSETNGEDESTRYVYDRANRRISIINPLNEGITITHDGAGNVIQVMDARGNPTWYGYDENDNLTVITNTLGYTFTLGYNEEDQQIWQRDPESSLTQFDYYPDGQLQQKIEPGGATTRYVYDPNKNLSQLVNARNLTTTFAYDPRDLLTVVTDPMNHTTGYEYDELKRLVARTDAEENTYHFDYDPLGRLITVTDPISGVTAYVYDAVGNRTVITYANGTTSTFHYNFINQLKMEIDALDRTWRYGYDDAGRLVLRVDGEWQATYYEYDNAGRLGVIVFGSTGKRVEFEHDANGNEIAMYDWNGTLTREFDVLNQPVTITDYLSHTLIYGWNPDGTLAALTYPDGQVLTYTYNADNRLETLALPGGQAVDYTYDPLGYLTQMAYSNETQGDYIYDNANRLTSLHNSGPDGTVIAWYDYVLDQVGNRVQTTERRPFAPDAPVSTVEHQYTYDDLYRLIRSTTSVSQTHEMSWDLDQVGNWERRYGMPEPGGDIVAGDSMTITYDHNPVNSLVRAGDWLYAYDRNGSRVTAQAPLTATQYAPLTPTFGLSATLAIHYEYNYENRLTAIHEAIRYPVNVMSGTLLISSTWQVSPTMEARYIYDGLGRRVEKWVTKTITTSVVLTIPTVLHRLYVYDGLNAVMEYEERDGVPNNTTAYYRDSERIVALERGPISDTAELRWYHYDNLGSAVALSDESGGLTTIYRYDEYGQLLAGDIDWNRYTYTGQEWDKETEFYHFYARHQDSRQGTWLTPDEWRGTIWRSETLHRYSYAGNNPINLVDAYGYYVLADDLIALGGGTLKGLATQGVGDLIGNVLDYGLDFGNYEWSSWEEYVASGVAGAIGTELMLYLTPVVGGAIEGALQPVIRDLLLNRSNLSDLCWQDTMRDAIVGAIWGGATAGIGDKLSKNVDLLERTGVGPGRIAKGLKYFVSKRALNTYRDLTKDLVEESVWKAFEEGITKIAENLELGILTGSLCDQGPSTEECAAFKAQYPNWATSSCPSGVCSTP